MHHDDQHPLVLPLDDQVADLDLMGGKGASLARLARAGIAVPGGFCITTDAYTRFVTRTELRDAILDAAAQADLDHPETLDRAARQVRTWFRQTTVPVDIADEIRAAYHELNVDPAAVAVRSSATAEDLPEHSFAGQQDTFLNIVGADALMRAVRDCWASLWTARAIGYRARVGIPPENVRLAVVVQTMVPADAAGVVFTADPVTGARDRITINAAWGLGEAVVSGAVTSDAIVLDRDGAILERHTGDKAVMTVGGADGTYEAATPEHLRIRPVLDDAEAEELAQHCGRIEELYGTPMDIEWARHDQNLFIVQARPITTKSSAEPEEWNDSRQGDFLWTSANVGEAMPSVMTPLSWSLFKHHMAIIKPLDLIPGVPQFGNIGGRMYMNVSLMASVGSGFDSLGDQITGPLPTELEIPPALSRKEFLIRASPLLLRAVPPLLPYLRRTAAQLAQVPARLATAREHIHSARTPEELAQHWDTQMWPTSLSIIRAFWASTARGIGQYTIRTWLRKHGVGGEDLNALSSGAGDGATGPLASLGPVVGLAQLARGEIDQRTFVEQWGHRSPDEFELSLPRPVEDPEWLDRQVAELSDSVTQVDTMLTRQRAARDEALARFVRRHPSKARALRRRMARAAAGARLREFGRSEWVRVIGVNRVFVLRAGELTGHGEDLFFLTIAELLAVLRGDEGPLARIPARRAAYAHYRALPTYPTFIRGRFDPDRWAANPHRRVDLSSEHSDDHGGLSRHE